MSAIEHHFARRGAQLPPVSESLWLDYVCGAGGVYARGWRPGLEVCIPVARARVRGLKGVEPYVHWDFPKLPARFLERMLSVSRSRCKREPLEALFHLSFHERLQAWDFDEGASTLDFHQGWHLEYPKQEAARDHVRPLCQGEGSSESRAIIEVHSHVDGEAVFSEVDDADEGGLSFRVYAVLGRIYDRPEVRCRVGLFGHFMQWRAEEFFELPQGVTDCNAHIR